MTFKAFWAGCWFGHALVRERRGKAYVFVCQDCGESRAILKGQKFKARRPAKLLKVSPFRKRA